MLKDLRNAENPATRYPGSRLQTSFANRFATPGPYKTHQTKDKRLFCDMSGVDVGEASVPLVTKNQQLWDWFAHGPANRCEARYARWDLTDNSTFFSRCNMCSVLCMPFVLTRVLHARLEYWTMQYPCLTQANINQGHTIRHVWKLFRMCFAISCGLHPHRTRWLPRQQSQIPRLLQQQ